MDCSSEYGNMGCSGGELDFAFQYAVDNWIEEEAVYHYTAKDGKCSYDASLGVVKANGYIDVIPTD